MIKLMITDLDDTLYSWIGFFIPAFYGMLDELSSILGIPKSALIQEYKQVHQRKGSVEYPFATLLLPSVKKAYPNATEEELLQALNPAFHKFNSIRKQKLELYSGVKETLNTITKMNIKIVGYTDSAAENGFYRLIRLQIADFFQHVYVSESQLKLTENFSDREKTQVVSGKKPNPEVIKKICDQENVAASETLYIGDSMTKDIYMAKRAEVTAVLCKYPTSEKVQTDLYKKLVAISHWTTEDFKKEQEIKELCKKENIYPDYIISSFNEILSIIQQLNT